MGLQLDPSEVLWESSGKLPTYASLCPFEEEQINTETKLKQHNSLII